MPKPKSQKSERKRKVSERALGVLWYGGTRIKSTNKQNKAEARLDSNSSLSNVSHPPYLGSCVGSIDLDADEVDDEGSHCCDEVREIEEGVEGCEGREGGDEEVVL